MKNLLFLPLAFLAACNYSINSSSTDPVVVKLEVSNNFVEGKTGWITASGAPAKFTINRNNLTSGHASRYECRAALKALINTIAYSDCSSGSFQPTPTAGGDQYFPNKNGTYTFEIRAIDLKNTQVATSSQDFYIHDSLDSVPTCPAQAFTDEQYYEAASQFLSMTSKFGISTELRAPFYKIEFSREITDPFIWTPMDNKRSLPTLRKSVRINPDKTLIIVKRTHNKWIGDINRGFYHAGTSSSDLSLLTINTTNRFASYQKTDTACSLAVDVRNIARRRYFPSVIYDGNGDPDPNFYNLHSEISAGYGVVAQDNELNVPFTSYHWISDLSTILNQRPIKRHFPTGYFVNSLQMDFINGIRTINPIILGFNTSCDVLVVNAKGKGVCFHNQTLQEPIQLRTVALHFPKLENGRSPITLSKHKTFKDASWQQNVDNMTPTQLENDFGDNFFLNP